MGVKRKSGSSFEEAKMSYDHIKVHRLNNPKIIEELYEKKELTEKIWEQLYLELGVKKEEHLSLIGDDDGNIYIIHGHKSQDDLFNLLKNDKLPDPLRERLLISYYDHGSRDAYKWKNKIR